MKNWIEDKIINYSDIIPGYAFKSKDFIEEGIPIIKIGNVKSETVDITNEETQYVEKSFLSSINTKYQISRGDILISLTGSHLTQPNSVVGRVGRFRDDSVALVNQRAAKINPKKKKSDKDFLYHLLSTYTLRKEIALLAHGAANQANVSHKDIEKIKVFWPPLPIQRKIAAILSAYDDLIENNNRRIAILEKMAEELYREWFVRLRFPGHEKVKVVKGVPAGWEVKRIGDIYKTASGGTPSRNESRNYNGEINWFKTGELRNTYIFDSEEKITQIGIDNSSAKIFENDTVIMAMYCAMDYISILGESGATNQACCAFIPKKKGISSIFTFHHIRNNLPEMIARAHGAAQQNLSQELIKNHKVFFPKEDLIIRFSHLLNPIHAKIRNLIIQNDNLKLCRNRLISRLMSGKIDVENLDIQFPESMQEEIANA